MNVRRVAAVFTALVLCAVLVFSCSKKEEQKTDDALREGVHSQKHLEGEVSYGIYFDEEGTKRTITLGKDEKELKIYIIVHFPDYIELAAVEFRLVLPEGLEVESDKFSPNRTMLLGTFEDGVSERLKCTIGPKHLLHVLTLNVTRSLKDAEIALLPSKESDFLGIALCEEGFPMVRASSFKAVVNPSE